MTKKSHNKKRNVGIIYEQLIQLIGSSLINNNLKEAKEEWLRLRKISKQENKDPRDIQKEEKGINPYKKSPIKSLEKVIEIFWEEKELILQKWED